MLAESEKMLRRLLGEAIEVVTHYGRAPSRVLVDPGQIDQVLLNLVINARDAMPSGGKLTIETKEVELDDSYTSEHFGVARGIAIGSFEIERIPEGFPQPAHLFLTSAIEADQFWQ